MRIIPKKTKIKIEFFKGISIGDLLVGFIAVLILGFLIISNIPFRIYIALGVLMLTVFLMLRLDDERNYVFLLDMLRHFSYIRVYQKLVSLSAAPAAKKNKKKKNDVKGIIPFTDIKDGFIHYGGAYYGAVIEIPSIEFAFFSEYRQDQDIEKGLGAVFRNISDRYSANLVKIERPVIYDDFISNEYQKIESLKRAYVNKLFTEDELKKRMEIVYERIRYLERICYDEKVVLPFYYLVLFEGNQQQLGLTVKNAINTLESYDLKPKRLEDKELTVFLRYTNDIDFDEREIENLKPEEYMDFAMPDSVEVKWRTVEVNGMMTHNFRVVNYPTTVTNAWGCNIFDSPGTKIVMKIKPLDRQKAIRAIDRSIDELRSQEETTGKSSKLLEITTHIETLSELLVMLQNDNESLLATNIYVTGYDCLTTTENKKDGKEPIESIRPLISGHKKMIRRYFNEEGFKLRDMQFQQFEAFVAGQVSAYDPKLSSGREIHSSSLAAVYPFVFSYMMDKGGISLGTNNDIPVFTNFFRRDSERVNSNMVIIGKSGSGKSFATKTLLSNLAAENGKIFVLDPENEYQELATNLGGKLINVGNASQGRLNPFHIITNLEDEEAEEKAAASTSFSTHLQFLEEFFRQILPDIESDAMEYLNNLIIRVYSQKGIDEMTDLSSLQPEDYPVFDNLYDAVLEEFQTSKSEYLRSNLQILMNYIAKFSTGGRNASLWNGPSTITTEENFIVFNFQSLLANRNNTIANAQMLLVLKWMDNEIIKNRDYNTKYKESRKIIIVIDEAHVFIDTKYPLALDFMFQLAKRIRKYNGMQIVITQNIKDFVGSEEIARKSTAIINACQYSLIFSLAPNDMGDLCKLYEKAGEINETEQEKIVNAKRGEAFVITSPVSRTSITVDTPEEIIHMFSAKDYQSKYFNDAEGEDRWEEYIHDAKAEREELTVEGLLKKQIENMESTDGEQEKGLPSKKPKGFVTFEDEEEQPEEANVVSLPEHMVKMDEMMEQRTHEIRTPAQAEASMYESKPGELSAMDMLLFGLQKKGLESVFGEMRETIKGEILKEINQPPQAVQEMQPVPELRKVTELVSKVQEAAEAEAVSEEWQVPEPEPVTELQPEQVDSMEEAAAAEEEDDFFSFINSFQAQLDEQVSDIMDNQARLEKIEEEKKEVLQQEAEKALMEEKRRQESLPYWEITLEELIKLEINAV